MDGSPPTPRRQRWVRRWWRLLIVGLVARAAIDAGAWPVFLWPLSDQSNIGFSLRAIAVYALPELLIAAAALGVLTLERHRWSRATGAAATAIAGTAAAYAIACAAAACAMVGVSLHDLSGGWLAAACTCQAVSWWVQELLVLALLIALLMRAGPSRSSTPIALRLLFCLSIACLLADPLTRIMQVSWASGDEFATQSVAHACARFFSTLPWSPLANESSLSLEIHAIGRLAVAATLFAAGAPLGRGPLAPKPSPGCPACNYDRTGLPPAYPCPECGHK